MRRGDIRTALLAVLAEGPGHGYELITRLEDKSAARWRPSPGSVYPTLQLFEDEGLVRSEERDGKRVYELTDAGRAEATERAERYGSTPWEPGPEAGRGGLEDAFRGARKASEWIRPAIPPLLMAVKQVGMSGSDAQRDKATKVLQDATKELYRIMADD